MKRGKISITFYGFWPDGEEGKERDDLPKSVYYVAEKGRVIGFRLSDGLQFKLDAIADYFVPCQRPEIFRYLAKASLTKSAFQRMIEASPKKTVAGSQPAIGSHIGGKSPVFGKKREA